MASACEEREALTIEVMRRNLNEAQSRWHSGCVACGSRSENGLGLRFTVVGDGCVEATFPCGVAFAGFPGCLHGGIISTLLDSAMTNAMFANGHVGLTGELTVRFYHTIEIGIPARVHAWMERSNHRLHVVRAELEQNGAEKAAAVGKFMESRLTAGEAGGQRNACSPGEMHR